jgi:hypothetical protein
MNNNFKNIYSIGFSIVGIIASILSLLTIDSENFILTALLVTLAFLSYSIYNNLSIKVIENTGTTLAKKRRIYPSEITILNIEEMITLLTKYKENLTEIKNEKVNFLPRIIQLNEELENYLIEPTFKIETNFDTLTQAEIDNILFRLNQNYKYYKDLRENIANRRENQKDKTEEEDANLLELAYSIGQEIIERLNSELNFIATKGNVYLMAGSILTIGAGVLLFFIAFNFNTTSDASFNDKILTFTFNIVPRLFVVIFIEIFAYFFLRLYRDSTHLSKFYHNELTNIQSKLTSLILSTALIETDNNSIKLVIEELVKTERNFILKKDETTKNLEKEQAELKIIGTISEIIKNLK